MLRQKDFARFTPGEVAQARAMMAQMVWDLGSRRTRRWRRGQARGPRLDLRTTLRRSLKHGGEPLDLARRQRKIQPRPLVLVCDVSGSMERYTRMLLHFIHALAGDMDRVEAFLFATRLTRITQHLEHRDIDRAVTEVSRAVPDWAGGTRIGENIKQFNYRWARRVLGWGAVVLLISDGWDRGDPKLLGQEMERLQRGCHRVIWLNPLLGAEDYQPVAQGMQAALPFVDDFLAVHNLASLEELSRHLNALAVHRPGRRQQIRSHILEAELARTPTPPPGTHGHRASEPTFRHPLWGKDG